MTNCVVLSRRELLSCFPHVDDERRVDYLALLRRLHVYLSHGAQPASYASSVCHRLQQSRRLPDALRRRDVDRVGELSWFEFLDAADEAGMDVTAAELRGLMDRCGVGSCGIGCAASRVFCPLAVVRCAHTFVIFAQRVCMHVTPLRVRVRRCRAVPPASIDAARARCATPTC